MYFIDYFMLFIDNLIFSYTFGLSKLNTRITKPKGYEKSIT
ncbi:hypothetical protein [Flavobacterium dankookense]|nr:hypothetical protein [Flavobacterium dankookense]